MARKSQESLALSAFMLADNIGRKKIQLLDFKDRRREIESLPKDLMKLLFNPYKNVGVYVENVHRTFFLFQYSMKKS